MESPAPLFPFDDAEFRDSVDHHGAILTLGHGILDFESEEDDSDTGGAPSTGASAVGPSRCNTIHARNRFMFGRGSNQQYNISYWNGSDVFPREEFTQKSRWCRLRNVVRWFARVADGSYAPDTIDKTTIGRLVPTMIPVPMDDDYNWRDVQKISQHRIAVHGIHAPLEIYRFELFTVPSGQKNARAINVTRRSLECTSERVMWLVSFVLERPMADVRMMFDMNAAHEAGLTQTLTYRNEEDDQRRRDVFSYLLEKIIKPRCRMALAATDALLTSEEDAARIRDYNALVENTVSESLEYVTIKTHPECIRYFGGHRYALLANYFPEAYLMNIGSIERLDRLYDIFCSTPHKLCVGMNELMLWPSSTVYWDQPRNYSLSLVSLSYYGLLHRLTTNGVPMAPHSGLTMAFVLHAVQYDHNVGKHMYSTWSGLMDRAISEDKYVRMMDIDAPTVELDDWSGVEDSKNTQAEAAEGGCQEEQTAQAQEATPVKRFETAFHASRIARDEYRMAISWLDRAKYIRAYNPHARSWSECASWSATDPRMAASQIYLLDAYMDTALVVSGIDGTLDNHKKHVLMDRPSGITRPPTSSGICSEQWAVLDMVEARGVLNITGMGGVGKTQAIMHLVNGVGVDKSLIATYMWSHADTARQRIPGAVCGGMHRIITDHAAACRRCIPGTSTEPNLDENSFIAMRELMSNMLSKEGGRGGGGSGGGSTARSGEKEYRSIFVKDYRRCPWENLVLLVVEECSTNYPRLFGALLWMLRQCAPNLRYLVTSGDLGQLPPIQPGHLQLGLTRGLGVFKFEHRHRQDYAILCDLADAIHQGNATRAETYIDERTVFLIPCDMSNLREVAFKTIKRFDLTVKNSQWITRTNEVKNTLIPLVNYHCSPQRYRPYNDRASQNGREEVYRRTNKLLCKHRMGQLNNNQQLEVVGTVFVEVLMVHQYPHPNAGLPIRPGESVFDAKKYAGHMPQQSAAPRDFEEEQRNVMFRQNVDAINGAAAVQAANGNGALLAHRMTTGPTPLRGLQADVLAGLPSRTREAGNFVPVHEELTAIIKEDLRKMLRTRNLANGGVDYSAVRYRMKHVSESSENSARDGTFPVLICRNYVQSNNPDDVEPPVKADRASIYYELQKLPGESELIYIPLVGAILNYIKRADVQTTHTYQGRGVPTVVFVEPVGKSPVATREMLFTAETRGISRVVFLMQRETFAWMINNPEPPRNCPLPTELAGVLKKHQHALVQPDLREAARMEFLEGSKYGDRTVPIVDMHVENVRRITGNAEYSADDFADELIDELDGTEEDHDSENDTPAPAATPMSFIGSIAAVASANTSDRKRKRACGDESAPKRRREQASDEDEQHDDAENDEYDVEDIWGE